MSIQLFIQLDLLRLFKVLLFSIQDNFRGPFAFFIQVV